MTVQKFRKLDLIVLTMVAVISDLLIAVFGILNISLFLSIAFPILILVYVRWHRYGAITHGAVVLGSEMSGGVKDLSVTQCYFKETDRGLRIKTRRGRGESARIDGITFENIYMDHVLTPLVMNMYYYCDDDGKTEYVWSKEKLPVDQRTPYLGSFKFKDIVCEHVHAAAGFFYGLPEQPIESIEIENVSFSYAKDAQPFLPAMMSYLDPMVKEGLHFRYVNHVSLKNVSIEKTEKEPIILESVKNFEET